MESLKWEEMSPSGNIPTPRAYCASLVIHGLGLFIFGGQGDSLYNSIYFYDFSINTWGLFIATGSAPSSRFSSCLTYAKLIYILGGKTIGDVSSEIWGYSPITNTFTLAKNLGTITIKLMNAICWSEVNPDHDIIYISSGEVSPQILNNNLYKLKIWEENNKLYYKVLSTYFDVYSLISNSETSQNLVGKYSLYFFGMAWSLFKKNNIAIFDYTENETKMLYANYSFYGHKTVHYRNKIFMYGGGMGKSGLKLPNEFSSNVFEIAFEDSDNFILPCSVGTIGENCTPCPAGTFYYNSTYCSPCGPGKYSTSLSATSGLVCTPCGFATFSDEYGGTSCKDCESGEICLPGSRKGKILTSKENQSIQPLKYNGKTLDITESIYPSLTILSLLIVVFFLIFKRKRHFLKKIDFYKANHSQEESKPIIAKSTEIGGIFSIFFIFAALATITISLYDLVNKNITEVKTLVPLVTITDEIVSKYVDFQVNFYNYGGFCINSQGDCLDEMSIEENTFEYTEKSVKCDFIDEVCSVKINYQGFRVASNSYFTISMNEYSAYTSYISLNATSYSSIPGEISSKLVYIFLDDNELIFKGSDPSIINLEFTSSVLEN